MKIEQKKWTHETGWNLVSRSALSESPQLVLVFGASALVKEARSFQDVKNMYPSSHIIMLSTAGEILDVTVSDNTLSLTAIHFEKTTLQFAKTSIQNPTESRAVGEKLMQSISKEGLVHTMVFSDGLKVNGTALVEGIASQLPAGVMVTGGLVGDGSDFKHTYVGLDATPEEGGAVIVGFYGEALSVAFGSMGGWDVFGPERIITKSQGNVLYELDHRPALELYKEYLGDKAKELPGSGLLFPLSLGLEGVEGKTQVVRTLLAVDEKEQSMTFAGDMPQGVSAQLMRANFERLISGASGAASMITKESSHPAQLVILISCVGRKLVLQQRVEEEVEAVRDIFGPEATLAGFYSYGEISPGTPTSNQCQLHNQTMTITTFAETA